MALAEVSQMAAVLDVPQAAAQRFPDVQIRDAVAALTANAARRNRVVLLFSGWEHIVRGNAEKCVAEGLVKSLLAVVQLCILRNLQSSLLILLSRITRG